MLYVYFNYHGLSHSYFIKEAIEDQVIGLPSEWEAGSSPYPHAEWKGHIFANFIKTKQASDEFASIQFHVPASKFCRSNEVIFKSVLFFSFHAPISFLNLMVATLKVSEQ